MLSFSFRTFTFNGIFDSVVGNCYFCFSQRLEYFHHYLSLVSASWQPWTRGGGRREGLPEQRRTGMSLLTGRLSVRNGNIVVEAGTVFFSQGRGANGGEPLPHHSHLWLQGRVHRGGIQRWFNSLQEQKKQTKMGSRSDRSHLYHLLYWRKSRNILNKMFGFFSNTSGKFSHIPGAMKG